MENNGIIDLNNYHIRIGNNEIAILNERQEDYLETMNIDKVNAVKDLKECVDVNTVLEGYQEANNSFKIFDCEHIRF